jgi:hypothetical protein
MKYLTIAHKGLGMGHKTILRNFVKKTQVEVQLEFERQAKLMVLAGGSDSDVVGLWLSKWYPAWNEFQAAKRAAIQQNRLVPRFEPPK